MKYNNFVENEDNIRVMIKQMLKNCWDLNQLKKILVIRLELNNVFGWYLNKRKYW